jgi:hypothetical protein
MRDGDGFNLIKLKAHGVDQFQIVSHEAAVELPVSSFSRSHYACPITKFSRAASTTELLT